MGPSPTFRGPRPSSAPLWMFAGCIAAVSIYRTENRTIVFLPALTSLLLIAQKHLQLDSRAQATSDSCRFCPLLDTNWGTILAATFAILTLSNWDLKASILSIVPATALLLIYLALLPTAIGDRTYRLSLLNFEEAIVPLSLRVVPVLLVASSLDIAVFGLPPGEVAPTMASGLAKALSWGFLTLTTRHTSWRIATAMGTFSIAVTRDPFRQSSGVRAFSHLVASLLAIGQVVNTLPKQASARRTFLAFSIIPLLPYLVNRYVIYTEQSSAQASFFSSQKHPVEVLMNNAQTDFEDLMQRQSQNYTAAHSEYHRRYGVEPPRGFKGWYEFAKLHQSPIIDEYDMIHHNLSPFWNLSGKEVLNSMTNVYNIPNNELWLCSIFQRKPECSHPYRAFDRHIQKLFDRLTRDLPDTLPNLRLLVNHLDEPRVLIPSRLGKVKSGGNGFLNMTNMSHQPIFDTITIYCPSTESDGDTKTRKPVDTFGLPFVTDASSALDLCLHPSYSTLHGLFISPTSFHPIEGLVPVLATGSPSTMGDILYPSASCIEPEFQYAEKTDVEWESKRNNLYWAGSTTGGFALDDKWRQYHRQRFVSLGQNLEKQQHSYLRSQNGVLSRVKSTFLNSRLFDVAFTRVFQCERKYCRRQRAYFDVASWADKDRALQSRLVFDIDGNGISGRFYKLLASKSLPLKQTLLREWHDERLQPWLHYVPVSQSMEELPELVTYLTSTKAGQDRSKEMAEYGRRWFASAFRDIDRSIYFYRLLLEVARLQDPERAAGSPR